MLKIYEINGRKFQFEEGKQPAGAVELKKKVAPPVKVAEEPAEKPAEKAKAPANKARKPANKSRRKAETK